MKAGTAKIAITPECVVDLTGYGARKQPSTSVHDEIYVRCVAIEQNGRKLAICSIEILGLDFEHVDWLRGELARDGYRPENLLFCGTHTHGGPAVQSLRLCGTPSPDYEEQLLKAIVKAVREAGKEMKECRISVGSAPCEMGANRRKPGPSGIEMVPNPEGDTDPELVAARICSVNGEPIATIFNYACHAVVLGGDNRLVTGDWPGAAMEKLQASGFGLTLFLQGCCGDVNPLIRDTWEGREKAADIAIAAVREALEGSSDAGDGPVEGIARPLSLPLLPNPSDEELRARQDEINAIAPDQRHFVDCRDLLWGADVINNPEKSRRTELAFSTGELRIGDLVIAWLPAEAFSAYSRAIKAARTPGKTMVAAYTNGNIGYLPTASAYSEGGYEVHDAYRYYAYQMIAPESEHLVLESFGAA